MQILTVFEQCEDEKRKVNSNYNSLCDHMDQITHMTHLKVNKEACAYQIWSHYYFLQCAWY